MAYVPGSHSSHESLPSSDEVPGAQRSHSDCPFVPANVPGEHGVAAVLPVVAKWPGSASVHSLAAARSILLEYDPAGQGSGTLVPAGQ